MSQVGEKARAAVRDGMELMRWQCDEAMWREWLQNPDATAGAPSIGPTLVVGGVGGAVTLAVMIPYPPLQWLAAAGGVALAGMGVADWRLKPRDALPLRDLDRDQPPEIALTTTGLLCGELALCWDAYGHRLVYSGIGGSDPLYLLFRFRVGSWFNRRLIEARLPVPRALEQDATEAARSIRRRLNPEDAAHLFRLESRKREATARPDNEPS